MHYVKIKFNKLALTNLKLNNIAYPWTSTLCLLLFHITGPGIWLPKEYKRPYFLSCKSLAWLRQACSVKGQIVNIYSFVGHVVSVSAIQLCFAARNQPWTICKKISFAVFQSNFIYKNGWVQVWLQGHSFIPLTWTREVEAPAFS